MATNTVTPKGVIQNRIVGVVGRKGTGKSTWVKNHLAYCPRVFVFDVMDENDAIKNRFESLPRVEQFFQWAEGRGTWAARYVPQRDLEESIEKLCPLVYRRGDCLFVCEEIALYTKPGSVSPEFGRLVRTGRHKKVSLVWVTQRPAECAKSITALTDIWILGTITEPRDLAALEDRVGHGIAEQVSKLREREFLIYDVASRRLIQDDPRILLLEDVRLPGSQNLERKGRLSLRPKDVTFS